MKFFTASLLAIAVADDTQNDQPAAGATETETKVMGTCAAECADGEKCMVKDTTDGCPDFELECKMSEDETKQEEECKAMVGCKFVAKVEAADADDAAGTPKVDEEAAKCEKDEGVIATFADKECECKTSSATRNLAVAGVAAMVALLI